MKPKTTFNGLLIAKIIGYLTSREGCSNSNTEYTSDGVRTVIQDAMGFRYEVQVKTIGRTVASDNVRLEYLASRGLTWRE